MERERIFPLSNEDIKVLQQDPAYKVGFREFRGRIFTHRRIVSNNESSIEFVEGQGFGFIPTQGIFPKEK